MVMDGGGLCMTVAKARCNGEMLVFSSGRLIKVALMGLWKYASQLMKWFHLAKPGDGVSCAIRFIVCLSSNYDFITEGGIGMESDIKKGASGWLSRCRTRM